MGIPTWASYRQGAGGFRLQCRRQRFWVGKLPRRREWQPTPVFLLENPRDRGAWRAVVHGVTQSRTQQSDDNSIRSPSWNCPKLIPSHLSHKTVTLLTAACSLKDHIHLGNSPGLNSRLHFLPCLHSHVWSVQSFGPASPSPPVSPPPRPPPWLPPSILLKPTHPSLTQNPLNNPFNVYQVKHKLSTQDQS